MQMTLANKITILRIILIPLFIISLLQRWEWSVLIYIPIMASDCADGLIARMRNERTTLGAFLDPLADRLLLIFTFLTLSYQRLIPRWILVLVLSRDFLVILGWFLIFIITDKKDVNPRLSGKVAVIFQMFFVLVTLTYPHHDPEISSPQWNFFKIFLYLTAFATIISMIDYTISGARKFGKETS